ncbi:MAG: TIGR03960 family B12-binding radical SAM protein [Cyanobacteria bacterium P01_D01_bin.123]
MEPAHFQTSRMAVIDVDRLLTPEINRPARYLGNEFGAARPQWQTASVRWVLTYPELYEVGASNSGHLILYNILNAQPRQLCDRTYLPAPDLADKLRRDGIPLFAVESRRALAEFDIVGFSLAYELGGTNILEMLDLAGIPLSWADRNERDIHTCPLVFAGGPTATSNPEPFAEFFDFFAIGDGEEVLPEIGLVVEEGLASGLSRREILLDLAYVPGVYVPQFYAGVAPQALVPGLPERVARRVATPMPHYAISGPIPYVNTVHDRLSIEVRRGCTRGCRFCQPGMLTRPARDVQPEDAIDAIATGLERTGYDEFSLSSLSCSDYLSLPAVGAELHNRLSDRHVNLSLPSQRVDRFDKPIALVMGGTRRPTVTFAPEAGTQRLRDIINKGLTNADLVRGVKTAAAEGWDRVKLYFMIGLPGETDADVVGIVDTISMLRRECPTASGRRLEFNVTISNFTPKPHTPFQWHRVNTEDFIRKQELLRQSFRKMRGVKVNFTDVRFSILEDFIGKGDRSLSRMIYHAWKQGAGMDSWWENIDKAYDAWVNAYYSSQGRSLPDDGTMADLPACHYDFDDPLPWDAIDTGIDKQWLKDDCARAMAAATVPDCSFESCSHCGICGIDFGHNIVLPPLPIAEIQPVEIQTQSVQRVRVTYAKRGSMRFVGHLDLMRLWERACRRAQLPLAFSGGYHPSPRISPATALSLGFTSRAEVVDIELYDRLECDALHRALTAQLPANMPISEIVEISLKAPSANQSMLSAEYTVTVRAEHAIAWKKLLSDAWTAAEIWLEKTSKSGKVRRINGRELLEDLELLTASGTTAQFRYQGRCRNDGTNLSPQQAIALLEKMAVPVVELETVRVERMRSIFTTPEVLLSSRS